MAIQHLTNTEQTAWVPDLTDSDIAQMVQSIIGSLKCDARNFEHALSNLVEWQYIWVLFWFDRNEGWRPKVLPPRSRSGRKGVFATRSPHRPNPLGLSAVRLTRVDGLTLILRAE